MYVTDVKFIINGTTGHGSLLLDNTVGEKARKLIDRIDDYRREQIKELEKNPLLGYSDVTSINLTIMDGGVQSNVIPPELTLAYDVRLSINVNHKQFETMLDTWCAEAGGNIKIDYEVKEPYIEPTLMDSSNVFWSKFKEACDEM